MGFGEHAAVGVKKPCRAIEMLWCTYNGNVRLLTDLVRSSIVCDTPAYLFNVFQRIRADPTVQILRLKNRLHPDYNSALSAGFRNLSLNLVVVDENTRRACTDAHICELQLHLKVI